MGPLPYDRRVGQGARAHAAVSDLQPGGFEGLGSFRELDLANHTGGAFLSDGQNHIRSETSQRGGVVPAKDVRQNRGEGISVPTWVADRAKARFHVAVAGLAEDVPPEVGGEATAVSRCR